MTQGTYKNGVKVGELYGWYKNGQMQYKKGVKDGELYGWYENGQMQWKQTHRNGKIVETELQWNRHGHVACKLDWGDGKTTPTRANAPKRPCIIGCSVVTDKGLANDSPGTRPFMEE